MPAKKKTKIPSGGKALYRAGKSLIWAPVTAGEKRLIRRAAASEGIPMSRFLVQHGLAAAEKILKKM